MAREAGKQEVMGEVRAQLQGVFNRGFRDGWKSTLKKADLPDSSDLFSRDHTFLPNPEADMKDSDDEDQRMTRMKSRKLVVNKIIKLLIQLLQLLTTLLLRLIWLQLTRLLWPRVNFKCIYFFLFCTDFNTLRHLECKFLHVDSTFCFNLWQYFPYFVKSD